MWLVEGRTPAFVDSSGGPGPSHQPFGLSPSYLWGNTAAIDCLNISHNEQASGVSQDFKLCFAASGDLRNLIKTINGLPEDYSGKCDILFNDLNPLIVGHNLVILNALLNRGIPLEEASELALHLMYSPFITKPASLFLNSAIGFLCNAPLSGNLSHGGPGTLLALMQAGTLERTINMLRSTYDRKAALQGYHGIMLNAQRQDYRDRYISTLRPDHRLAFSRFRHQGVLAPFWLDTIHFTEPNRLLFSPRAEWLLRDSESPLFGWDVSEVIASGISHGLESCDLYGCLFFHVKDQFVKFASRIRNFDINLTMTNVDARHLPNIILKGGLSAFHPPGGFDRIETSNLADYLTVPRILNDWGPLLNRQNCRSTLLMYMMNWQGYEAGLDSLSKMSKVLMTKYASIIGVDLAEVYRHDNLQHSPKMFQFVENIGAFIDEGEKFDKYLRDMDTHHTAVCQGLTQRKVHRIHPKRFGLSLSSPQRKVPDISKSEFYNMFIVGGAQPSIRFVEFEVAV